MKKCIFLAVVLLCVNILFSACQTVEDNPSTQPNNTTQTSSTEPTILSTQPTEQTQPPTEPPTQPSEQTQPPTEPPTEPQPTDPDTGLPVYVPGSIELNNQNGSIFAPENRQYRLSYYLLMGEFSDIISKDRPDEFAEWQRMMEKSTNYGEHFDEMYLVSFIKHFNIPREEFDKAVKEYNSHRTTEELKKEFWEAPNADIIYTFDNEIINEYYRYE